VLVFASIWFFSSAGGVKQSVLNVLSLFAVGTLLGDVFLHLLPSINEGVESQLAVLGGILFFFVVDRLLSHKHSKDAEGSHSSHSHDALLNIAADILHNFLDGMAIASSFSISSFVGVTTTFAIFFHEISHEVGDFVMLLRSGYTLRQAYLSNFVTGLGALAGTCLTLWSSTSSLEAYILPTVVGNFLYIALVSMMASSRKNKGLGSLASEVLAYTLGVSFMYIVILLE
jgi:zinc transporter ZupT